MSSRTASDTPSRLRRLRKICANSLRLRALVITKRVMHANHRQRRAEQGDVDRLEAVGDAETEIARRGDLAQIADGAQLQATNGLGAVLHEQHFIGGTPGGHLGVGDPGQKHRGHP